jgi:hypothetical protein
MTDPFDSIDQPALRRRLNRTQTAALAAVALMLAAVAAPHVISAVAESVARANQPPPPPPLKPSPANQFRGITLQMHSNWEGIPYEKYVEEIARSGANTLCISLAGFQENSKSNSLFIEYRRIPPIQRLEKLIALAHERGLSVALMPIVLLENPGPAEWRGKIDPPKPDAWWEDYTSFILYFANLAQRTEAEIFLVGSELVSIEHETKRWRGLIEKVREAYPGRLAYSANWDHYRKIKWWEDLDMIGMTTYHDLVGEKEPSLEVLMDSWRPIKREILAWRKKINRPLLFTEVGWPSQVGCAKEPWNYYGSDTPDVKTQALCFEAFFRTWADEKTVAGVLIWEWRNHPDQDGGPKDTSYIPNGKPAMKVIREFFKSPDPWAASQPASRPRRP